MQQFSAGKALSDAFAIFKARFVPMAAITILYFVAIGALMGTFGMALIGTVTSGLGTTPGAGGEGLGGGMILSVIVLYVAIYAANFWQQGAMCRLTSDRHDGSLGDAASAGLRSILPLFGVLVVVLVAFFVGSLLFGLVVGGAAMGADSGAVGVIAMLVLIGGIIFLALRLSMVLPIIAIEDQRNPIAALSRSWNITRGSVLKLLAVYLLVGFVMGIIGFALISTTLGASFATPGQTPDLASMGSFFAVMVIFGLTLGVYLVALIGAIYRQLGGESVADVEATFG